MEKSVHVEAQRYAFTFLFVEWKQREDKIYKQMSKPKTNKRKIEQLKLLWIDVYWKRNVIQNISSSGDFFVVSTLYSQAPKILHVVFCNDQILFALS